MDHDVIPLRKPVRLDDGKVVTEVPVTPGQVRPPWTIRSAFITDMGSTGRHHPCHCDPPL